MATVWSATNVFTERQFAIKFLLPTHTEEVRRRFLLEAKASARIDHPNIIEVIDVGQTDDGVPFMVMELLTGISLYALLVREVPAEARMRLFDFCSLMLDVARALGAAHERGIVHRDLKPTNIFLSQDRQGLIAAKVLDFGVSKFLTDDRGGALTVTGTILGSPMYMSPEQAQGARDIDGRTDIFAFGSIMFEALVGYRCFEAAAFGALLVKVSSSEPRSIDACAPHLPEPLRALVRGCLVVDRARRIASFDEIAARLEHLLPVLEHDPRTIATVQRPQHEEALEVPARPRAKKSRSAKKRVRRVRAQIALLAIGFGAIVFGVVYTAQRPRMNRVQNARVEITSSPAAWNEPGAMASADPPAGPATADPPLVSVDSLPTSEHVNTRAPHRERRPAFGGVGEGRPASGGVGHLHVTSGTSCIISIDGTALGTREVDLEAAPGAHRLRCDDGEVDPASPEVSVNVSEGSTTRYAFP